MEVGTRVRILHGKQAGKTGTIISAHAEFQMVIVELDGGGLTRAYLPDELEVITEGN